MPKVMNGRCGAVPYLFLLPLAFFPRLFRSNITGTQVKNKNNCFQNYDSSKLHIFDAQVSIKFSPFFDFPPKTKNNRYCTSTREQLMLFRCGCTDVAVTTNMSKFNQWLKSFNIYIILLKTSRDRDTRLELAKVVSLDRS